MGKEQFARGVYCIYLRGYWRGAIPWHTNGSARFATYKYTGIEEGLGGVGRVGGVYRPTLLSKDQETRNLTEAKRKQERGRRESGQEQTRGPLISRVIQSFVDTRKYK